MPMLLLSQFMQILIGPQTGSSCYLPFLLEILIVPAIGKRLRRHRISGMETRSCLLRVVQGK